MKSRQVKDSDLATLRQEFGETDTAFLVEFRGLTVVAVDDLRRQIREAQGSYRVVKNTLARRASEGTAMAGLVDQFVGPTAVVGAPVEPTRVAKTLAEFAKKNAALTVKGGVVAGDVVDAAACEELASIGSREELLTKLLFLMQSPLRRLVGVLSAPVRNLAVVLGQVAEKKAE